MGGEQLGANKAFECVTNAAGGKSIVLHMYILFSVLVGVCREEKGKSGLLLESLHQRVPLFSSGIIHPPAAQPPLAHSLFS